MPISPKQHRFIEEFLLDRCGTQAAIRAGYSARSAREIAHRLLTKDHIRRAVALRAAHQAAELKITREQVMRSLVVAYEVAKAKQDAGSMVRAAAELGKMCGFYDPPAEEEPPPCDDGALGDAQAVIEAMSDEELLAMASYD